MRRSIVFDPVITAVAEIELDHLVAGASRDLACPVENCNLETRLARRRPKHDRHLPTLWLGVRIADGEAILRQSHALPPVDAGALTDDPRDPPPPALGRRDVP